MSESVFYLTEFTVFSFVLAFVAGLASFLSPCILPLLPGYLSYVSGVGVSELGFQARKVGIASVAFIIGFVVFLGLQGFAFGLAGSALGDLFTDPDKKRLMEIIAGVTLVVFGVFTLGVINTARLFREKRVKMVSKPVGFVGVVLAGMVFSLGIGPCTGFLVGSIWVLATESQNPYMGASLMITYGLGVGLPFVLFGFLFPLLFGSLSFFKRHFNMIKIVSGSLLIAFGLVLALFGMKGATDWLNKVLPNIPV